MSQITYPLGLPKELYDEVKHAAKETGLSTADVLRQAIKFGVPKVRQALSREEDLSEAMADTWNKLGPPPKFKLVKQDGFTVIETDRKVSQETIDALLTELP